MSVLQPVLQAHPVLAALVAAAPALVVALIDFLLAVNPNLKSNGIVHFVYLQMLGKASDQVAADQKQNPSS